MGSPTRARHLRTDAAYPSAARLPQLLADWRHGDGGREASGTGFFDATNRTWSDRMIAVIDPDGALGRALPPLVSPLEPIGTVRPAIVERFGFSPKTLVACGSGDNVMGAVGTGSVRHGRVTLGLGTSGVINVFSDHPIPDLDRSLQVFCGSKAVGFQQPPP